MIHGSVSLKNIISKTIRDLQYSKDFPWQNAIEWGAEALQHIGAYGQFEKRCEKIDIQNHRGILPCDFHQLLQVSYNGKPLSPGTGSFMHLMHTSCFSNNKDTDLSLYEQATIARIELQINSINQQLAVATNVTVIESLNNSLQDLKKELLCVLNRTSTLSPILEKGLDERGTYWIGDYYIKTSFANGTVFIAYMAIPTDDEGFPLVPDDISYREAIYRYITMKMMYIEYLRGNINSTIYLDMENKWHWYCKQARATSNMPDLGMLESIKNQWVRLIPNINQFDTFFNDLNSQEQLHL